MGDEEIEGSARRDDAQEASASQTRSAAALRAMAFLETGAAFVESHDLVAAAEVFQAAIMQFGNSTDPELQLLVATAYDNWAQVLLKSDEHDAAILVADEMIDRLGECLAPSLESKVAMAFITKAAIFADLDDLEREFDTYKQLIERFRDSTLASVQAQVATAYVYAGIAASYDYPQAADDCWVAAISRFRSSTIPEVQKQVSVARDYLGIVSDEDRVPFDATLVRVPFPRYVTSEPETAAAFVIKQLRRARRDRRSVHFSGTGPQTGVTFREDPDGSIVIVADEREGNFAALLL